MYQIRRQDPATGGYKWLVNNPTDHWCSYWTSHKEFATVHDATEARGLVDHFRMCCAVHVDSGKPIPGLHE